MLFIQAGHCGPYILDITVHTRWTLLSIRLEHFKPHILDTVVYVIPDIASHVHVRRLCVLISHLHNIPTYLETFLLPSMVCVTRSMDGIGYCMRSTAARIVRLGTLPPGVNVLILLFKMTHLTCLWRKHFLMTLSSPLISIHTSINIYVCVCA